MESGRFVIENNSGIGVNAKTRLKKIFHPTHENRPTER
jgi:hypothetical protein